MKRDQFWVREFYTLLRSIWISIFELLTPVRLIFCVTLFIKLKICNLVHHDLFPICPLFNDPTISIRLDTNLTLITRLLALDEINWVFQGFSFSFLTPWHSLINLIFTIKLRTVWDLYLELDFVYKNLIYRIQKFKYSRFILAQSPFFPLISRLRATSEFYKTSLIRTVVQCPSLYVLIVELQKETYGFVKTTIFYSWTSLLYILKTFTITRLRVFIVILVSSIKGTASHARFILSRVYIIDRSCDARRRLDALRSDIRVNYIQEQKARLQI